MTKRKQKRPLCITNPKRSSGPTARQIAAARKLLAGAKRVKRNPKKLFIPAWIVIHSEDIIGFVRQKKRGAVSVNDLIQYEVGKRDPLEIGIVLKIKNAKHIEVKKV